jgi:hypothetical protein
LRERQVAGQQADPGQNHCEECRLPSHIASIVGFPTGMCATKGYNREAMEKVEEPRRDAQSENEPMLYCPVCCTRLTERKCKLFCEKCGYYLSCADYY